MTWRAALIFCTQKNSHLGYLSELYAVSSEISEGRYWINNATVYPPQDPLEGWHWRNGSLLNNTNNREWLGNLRYTGRQKRCAVVTVRNSYVYNTWEDRPCNMLHRFICKMKEPVLNGDTSNVEQYSKEFKRKKFQEMIDRIKSRCKKSIEAKVNCNRIENILTDVRKEIIPFVRSKKFTGAFYNETEDIEFDVSTSSYEHLLQTKNTVKIRNAAIPSLTIDKLCQGRPSCVVKSIKIHVNNSLVNCSRLTNSPLSAVADITVLEYIADAQLIKKFEENETISIKFSKRNKNITCRDQVNCVFLNGTEWSADGMNLSSVDEYNVVCKSNHLSSFAMVVVDNKKSLSDGHKKALQFICYIGSGISLAGLFITSVVYVVLYKDLQILTTTRHLVHFNLQIALVLTQIVFLAGGNATQNEIFCKIVAILVHYFSLSAFSWIFLEVVLLYLKLISVYGGEYIKMKTFYLVGWGLPLVIVGLSAGVKTDNYGSDEWCWLSYKNGFQWIFFAPVIIISLVTLVAVIAVTRVLFRLPNSEGGDRMKRVISAARGVVILFPTLGLSWAFSVIAVNHDALVWKYLFAIFSSLQGFLIFLIYGVCNEEIRAAVVRRISSDILRVSTTEVKPNA